MCARQANFQILVHVIAATYSCTPPPLKMNQTDSKYTVQNSIVLHNYAHIIRDISYLI